MRFLIGCPVPPMAAAGPATVARELECTLVEGGDEVEILTFSPFERRVPTPLRQVLFFLRAYRSVKRAERIILLDPASTGPVLAVLAEFFGRPSILRIGGDFLWESYVARTGEQITLSEFYLVPRSLSVKERWIRRATRFTLRKVTKTAFNTEWQRALWRVPYHVSAHRTLIIENMLGERSFSEAKGHAFLYAARNHPVKNSAIIKTVEKDIVAAHPEVVFDSHERTPEEYEKALADCYAVVLPSLSDVAPNALYEAVRRGKPFVATQDTGVHKEFKEFGIFVDTRDARALSEAIVELLRPGRYEAFRTSMRDYTMTRTWSEVANDFKKAFQ